MQLDGEKDLAKNAYQRLIKAFPKDAEFTGLGLRRLASISADKDAMAFLDLVIEKFPQEAPEALVAKAKLLERLKNQKAAAETRQFLLNNYPKSEAAAEYRWQVAEKYADSGDLVKAWQWAQPITVNNPEDDIAAKAGFWVGKWATRLGRTRDAKKAFEYVLHTHPESYYAWRSADLLGWNVGNFTSVRAMTPEVAVVNNQFVPPAGSETFKELYLLGEKRDALTLWKAETAGKQELTVPEQFTNGVLLLSQGKNLQGINQVWQLAQREKPEEIQQWQELRKTPTYWLALFPFPYQDIIFNWSSQRQLNPLLVTSLIRQESRFEKEIRSPVGATGLMQVMPGTASWIAEKINVKDYSLTKPEDNVKLGTWYLDYTHREYNNNSMLAVASYNAGPGNVAKWVKQQGLGDADEFVEKIPFPETRGYVESVFGNYWNYLRLYDSEIGRLLKS
jgi:soluble lytic murein transglycosylase